MKRGCTAAIYHGLRHYRKTYCQKRGLHKIHKAIYGCHDHCVIATWRGDKAISRKDIVGCVDPHFLYCENIEIV